MPSQMVFIVADRNSVSPAEEDTNNIMNTLAVDKFVQVCMPLHTETSLAHLTHIIVVRLSFGTRHGTCCLGGRG